MSQFIFACLFLFLFIKTDYTGSDSLEYVVNILFRLDPLLAACVMLASRAFIALMWPALLLVVLSLLLGRSFCGWVCPMGSFIDFCHPLIRLKESEKKTFFPRLPLILLIFVVVGAFFQMPLVGYVDPFSILVRGLALSWYPAFHYGVTSFFTMTYQQAPDFINSITEPFYSLLQATLLPFEQKYFGLTYLSATILVTVFGLELWQRRFFCRNICPLGGGLGLLARVGFFYGHGGDDGCGKCHICQSVCRMGAINEKRDISPQACTLCLECQVKCPRSVISFGFSKHTAPLPSVSLSRRQFIGCLAGSALLPVFKGVRPMESNGYASLVRPPGAMAEMEFLGRCVRCGECMQVCIGNALQPAFLQAGFEGMFSPVVVARIGYCEYSCTLCGQVCPTGAIENLSLADKHRRKIGNAHFDKNLCLPYAKGVPCIVCEEHCPTPQKAIAFREKQLVNSAGRKVLVKQPYIIDELCIGCGICENKCPIPGQAAVRLSNVGAANNPDNSLYSSEYGS